MSRYVQGIGSPRVQHQRRKCFLQIIYLGLRLLQEARPRPHHNYPGARKSPAATPASQRTPHPNPAEPNAKRNEARTHWIGSICYHDW